MLLVLVDRGQCTINTIKVCVFPTGAVARQGSKMAIETVLLLMAFAHEGHTALFSPEFEQSLISFVNTTIQCRNVPGFTLSVVKGNETWSRGFGFADLDTNRAVTPNTLFGIGSVTKAMTVALLDEMLREKGFNWTSKVSDVLDGLSFVDEERTDQTTIRDILAHRTGLAALDLGIYTGYPASVSRAELSKNRMKYFPAQIPFRDAFLYNNFMYMLAGHVTESLAEESWEDAITSRLFEPIGMTSTRIMKKPDDVLTGDVARPYRLVGDVFENGTRDLYNIHPVEPAGAVLSSADDMAKWMRWNLHRLRSSDKNLTKFKEVYQSHAPPWLSLIADDRAIYRPVFPISNSEQGYGYGWFVSNYRGFRKIWHSGGLYSYISYLWLFPDIDAGVFASTNGPAHKKDANYALATVVNFISDHVIGEEPWLNETTSCTYPKPWRDDTKNETSSNPTTTDPDVTYSSWIEFEGTYGSKIFTEVQISSNRSNLVFTMFRVMGPLLATSERDKFNLQVTSPPEIADTFMDPHDNPILLHVNFTRDTPEGVVTGFVMDTDVPLTFVKGADFTSVLTSASVRESQAICLAFMAVIVSLLLTCH